MLVHQGKQLRPTGFGHLLLGDAPRDAMPQAGILGTIHYEDGREETKDFEEAILFTPDKVIQWLRDKLPDPISRGTAKRENILDKFYELVREGTANALIHRDYSIQGAKCQVVVDAHTLTIWSPGEPVSPITLEQLKSFNAPMLSRNPTLHYAFSKLGLAEERGLGLKSFKGTKNLDLPLPEFQWEAPYLKLVFYRSADAGVRVLPRKVLEQLNDSEKLSWDLVTKMDHITTGNLAKALGKNDEATKRQASRHLKRFSELNLIRLVGKGRSAYYERS
jgi:ATP-dependent DNA helicase RecG